MPVVIVCRDCNNGFSKDEQYVVAFLSCVLSGSTDPLKHENKSAARSLTKSPALRAMIQQGMTRYQTMGGETRTAWIPDQERIDRVVLKNARGHAYFEYGEPMLDPPALVASSPLEALSETQRTTFEGLGDDGSHALWPEVGSRMMTRMLTGQDMRDGWVVVQEGAYRYVVDHGGGRLRVKSVISEYLATEVMWER